MATTKILSMRLKSVKSIQKITKSMRMVSAAKYSRAERDLRVARTHGDGMQTFYKKVEVVNSNVDPKVKKVIIAITSDKGLCGAVHTQIIKEVKKDFGKSPSDTKIVCIGDRSRSQLQNTVYGNNIALVVQEMGRMPPKFVDASNIALRLLNLKFDVGRIIYNKFKTVVAYNVSHVNLFSRESVLGNHKSHVYESLDSEIDNYMEFSLASLIYYTLKESACSEQASRMTAMENASKNAGDMINMLTLKLNRTRQASITRELIEIISGAAAV